MIAANRGIEMPQSSFSAGTHVPARYVTDEIRALALHHLDILKRRFPNYNCHLFDWPYCWIRADSNDSVIFTAIFYTDSLKIAGCAKPICNNINIVNYADPRFTDDFISDILREWI